MVEEQKANVVVYGGEEAGAFVSDKDAFHAWAECDGWLIDFMAPIMGSALREDGRNWVVPRRMLQKRLSERKAPLATSSMPVTSSRATIRPWRIRCLTDRVQFSDLMNACMASGIAGHRSL